MVLHRIITPNIGENLTSCVLTGEIASSEHIYILIVAATSTKRTSFAGQAAQFFPLVGIGCLVGGSIFQFGSEVVIKHLDDALPYVFLCLIMIIGAGMILGTYLTSKRKHEVCTYCITANCVEVKSRYHRGTRSYCPIYEVYFRDETIQICNNLYTNLNRVEVGEVREVYLNPDNPKEFFEPKEEKSAKLFTYAFGSAFIAISAFALVMVLFIA